MSSRGHQTERLRLDAGYHSAEERRRAVKRGVVELLPRGLRCVTPLPFAEVLVAMARTAKAVPCDR